MSIIIEDEGVPHWGRLGGSKQRERFDPGFDVAGKPTKVSLATVN
jgi:hypothetical protein